MDSFYWALRTVLLTWCFCSAALADDVDLANYTLKDFVADAGARTSGDRSFDIWVDFVNPTPFNICIYPLDTGDVLLASVEFPQAKLIAVSPMTDSSDHEGSMVAERFEISRVSHKFFDVVAEFDPAISLDPGDHYPFHFTKSFKTYVMLNQHLGPGDEGQRTGLKGQFAIELGKLYIVRCARLTGPMRRNFQRNEGFFDSPFHFQISPKHPNGDYWHLDSAVVGQPFHLDLPSLPNGAGLVIFD